MNGKRVLALARRIIRQIAHDRRTVALVLLGQCSCSLWAPSCSAPSR